MALLLHGLKVRKQRGKKLKIASSIIKKSLLILIVSVIFMTVCYLTSTGCTQTRSTFVNENGVLAEFSGLVQRGILRSVDSSLDGFCLTDLINEYSV